MYSNYTSSTSFTLIGLIAWIPKWLVNTYKYISPFSFTDIIGVILALPFATTVVEENNVVYLITAILTTFPLDVCFAVVILSLKDIILPLLIARTAVVSELQ